MAQAAQCLDIRVVNLGRIRERSHSFVDARFAQQVQRRVWRAVGVVGNVFRLRSGELVVRVKVDKVVAKVNVAD